MTFEKADHRNPVDRFRYDVNLRRSAHHTEKTKMQEEKAQLEVAVTTEKVERERMKKQMEEEKALLEMAAKKMQEEKAQLEAAVTTEKAERERMKAEMEEEKALLEMATKNEKKARETVQARAEFQAKGYETEIETLRTECGEAMSRLVEAELELQRLRRTCEKQEKEIERCEKKLAEAQLEIESLNTAYTEQESIIVFERKEIRAQRAALREEKMQAQREVQAFETKLLETSQKLDDLTV